MEFNHTSVLLKESIVGLNILESGIYFDGTAGAGGHSIEILKLLKTGKLFSVDRDKDAIKCITKRFENYNQSVIVHDNFCNVKGILNKYNITGVDGILLDLGVSSYQIDNPDRGFSYKNDGPLDMRMSENKLTAKQIVNNFMVEEIAKILYDFGEEKFSYSIAKNIELYRKEKSIETTLELVEIIKKSVPEKYKRLKHPAKKTFQALRIFVNDEIESLNKSILDCFGSLNSGGRLAVITFHSIEDRIVKNCFKQLCVGCICPSDFPICICGKKPSGKLINKKPILPSDFEIGVNSRSKSAKLRVIERI